MIMSAYTTHFNIFLYSITHYKCLEFKKHKVCRSWYLQITNVMLQMKQYFIFMLEFMSTRWCFVLGLSRSTQES